MKIILLTLILTISTQAGLITGRVTTENGQGIGRATINAFSSSCPKWHGTQTRTNSVGYYYLLVPDCDVMVVEADHPFYLPSDPHGFLWGSYGIANFVLMR